MNIQTVGMENLPNVYIDEIFIYHTRDTLFEHLDQRFVVRLVMYDHHPNPSWYRDELSDLKVKVAFVSDSDINSLNNGESSLYSYEPDGGRVQTVSVLDFIRSGDKDTEGFRGYKKDVEITMDKTESLNVYAACFVDGLNFGSDLLNKFYGPMAAEKIYVGGEVNNQSGYFYYPSTNEEYGGPVHGHNDSIMEGSEHVETPHENLRYVAEDNYKIKVISGITDPNEFVNEGPGPQSGAGNREREEMLGGVEVPDVNENFNPPTEIEEDPNAENTPGSNFDPDETGVTY